MLVLALQLLFLNPSYSSAMTSSSRACSLALTTARETEQFQTDIQENGLVLTPLSSLHFEPLKELFLTEDVKHFFLGKADPQEATISHIERANKASGEKRKNFDGLWAIEVSGEFAGMIMLTEVGLDRLTPEHAAHFSKESPDDLYLAVGYALNSKFRGQGIASRSLSLIIDFAKTQLNAKYLFASTNILNDPSKNILNRAGFEILPTSDAKRVKFYKPLTY